MAINDARLAPTPKPETA